MSPAATTILRDPHQEITVTTCFIPNLHCPSCVEVIRESLSSLEPKPDDIFVSIVSHSVVVRHAASLAIDDISNSLEAAGFEIHSIFQDESSVRNPVEVRIPGAESTEWHTSLERAVSRWGRPVYSHDSNGDMHKRQLHLEQCEQCRREEGGVSLTFSSEEQHEFKPNPIVTTSRTSSLDIFASQESKSPTATFAGVETADPAVLCKVTLAITGMTCSSCVSAITHAVQQLPSVQSININLLTHTGTVVFSGKHRCDEVVNTIEDCGFDVLVEKLEDIVAPGSRHMPASKARSDI
jgi:Cu+-exporting ATPase